MLWFLAGCVEHKILEFRPATSPLNYQSDINMYFSGCVAGYIRGQRLLGIRYGQISLPIAYATCEDATRRRYKKYSGSADKL